MDHVTKISLAWSLQARIASIGLLHKLYSPNDRWLILTARCCILLRTYFDSSVHLNNGLFCHIILGSIMLLQSVPRKY
jgi:hypothetical protein